MSRTGRTEGWIVLDDHIYKDVALSGMSKVNRLALEALQTTIKNRSCPFDCVIVSATDRLSRNISDLLTITDSWRHYHVNVFVVDQQLDSSDPNFRLMSIMFAVAEENCRERLRRQMLNGKGERIRSGFSVGGSSFGYCSGPAGDDADRTSKRARKLQVLEPEATTVRRIFELFVGGASPARIAVKLNDERLAAPRNARNPERSTWNRTTVELILKNPLYIGKMTWNKTSQVINPMTGERGRRRNHPEMWVHVDVPALRVISGELWARVQDRFNATRRKVASQKGAQQLPNMEHATASIPCEAGALEPEETWLVPAPLRTTAPMPEVFPPV